MRISIFFLFFAFSVSVFAQKKETSFPILLVSDIHFDPIARYRSTIVDKLNSSPVSKWEEIFESAHQPSLSGYHSDTNYSLFKSALTAMKAQVPNPPLIIITGDFLRHDFRNAFENKAKNHSRAMFEQFVDKTVQFIATTFKKNFPDAQIIPALGNNDSPCGDYATDPHSAFLAAFAKAWQGSVKNTPQFLEEFSNGGHFSARFRASAGSEPLRLIAFNDVYWAIKYKNSCGVESGKPDLEELNWLKAQLSESEKHKEKVWILTHMPAGLNFYSTFSKNPQPCSQKDFILMFTDSMNEKFLNLVHEYRETIRLSLSGHTHMNEFHLYGGDHEDSVLNLGIPAVSPVIYTNPAFQVLEVDSKYTPINLTTYALNFDSGQWKKEYDFLSAYHEKDMSVGSFRHLAHQLSEDASTKERYRYYFASGSLSSQLMTLMWGAYVCSIANLDAASFSGCYCDKH